MGCGNSIEFVVNPDVKGQTASLLDTADKLMLYKYQVDKLYAVFKHLDLDGGGEVSISEFCANMEIEPTKFTDLVFKLIDRSGTKNFDFEEFLVFCYYYLTLDMAKLNAFAFDMFDVNSNGHLDRDEVNMMARVLWGSERFNSNQIGKILEGMEYNIEGDISKPSFLRFIKKFPLILQPAFTIQRTLRAKILGHRFWEVASTQRHEDHGDKTIFEILDIENETYKQFESVLVNSGEHMTAKFVESLNWARKHTQRRQTERLEKGFAHAKALSPDKQNQHVVTRSEREKNAEIMKKRKGKQMREYNAVGAIRRLTVTASDIHGNKYTQLIEKENARQKMEQSAAGLTPSKKATQQQQPGMGRRISHMVMSKLGVLVPKNSKSAGAAAGGGSPPSSVKKPGMAQRLSVMVMGMTKTGKNRQEVRENKYAATHDSGKSAEIISDKALKPSDIAKAKVQAKKKKGGGGAPAKKPGMVKRVSMMLGINSNKNKVAPAFTNIGDEEESDDDE